MFASISPLFTCLAALAVVDAVPTKRANPIPDFALKYAPLSYLHSDEQYWPADVANHLPRVIPEINFESVGGSPTLQSLSSLASNVYLTAVDNVIAHDSSFFTSTVGKPVGGVSAAPATVIVAEKAGGITDAFYFYFYSFNYGNTVLGVRFGNHVGDWEHTMVRFINSVPDTVYYSQHNGGTAYKYSAVERIGDRPVSYTAVGTHANYATSGDQNYDHIPLGLLKDKTNKGPIWDVTKNFRGFWYDPSSGAVSSASGAGNGATLQGSEGTSWLNFAGAWGDEKWPNTKFGQYCVSDQCHIVNGPTGPLSKNLGRTAACEHESSCDVKTSL